MHKRLCLLIIAIGFITHKILAQESSSIDDLAYVLDASAEADIQAAATDLAQTTGALLNITLQYEADDLQENITQSHDQWLAQQTQGISIIVQVSKAAKAYQNCHLQISPALQALLPQAQQQHIVEEVIAPVPRPGTGRSPGKRLAGWHCCH